MTLQELNEAEKTGRRLVFVDQFGQRWRQNGKVKRWKRDILRVEVPVKFGLYRHGTVHTSYLANLTLE